MWPSKWKKNEYTLGGFYETHRLGGGEVDAEVNEAEPENRERQSNTFPKRRIGVMENACPAAVSPARRSLTS